MYIDDFLKFISDSFSLFTNMSFGSKVKFLIEQCLVILVLWAIGAIAFNVIYPFDAKTPQRAKFWHIRH